MFTIHHSLCCLLDNIPYPSYKTLRLSSNPDIDKIKEVYTHNAKVLDFIIKFCKLNNIKSYRVSSSIFPLLTHPSYITKCLNVLEHVGNLFKNIDFGGIHLSCHPDQFILLSSMNDNVNNNSIRELNMWAYIAKEYIPVDLVNIHVGAKTNGIAIHREIFYRNFDKLDDNTKKLISLENDEKSYSFLETLEIAEKVDCMMVPDFHHHRCMNTRYNKEANRSIIDDEIYNNVWRVLRLYKNKVLPTFHVSSPFNGWDDSFKGTCKHADDIHILDYPHLLKDKITCDVRLDIEAKRKQNAIFALNEQLQNEQLQNEQI